MLDVRRSEELQAAILAMRRMRSELRREVYSASRAQLGSAWLPALRQRTGTRLEAAVLLRGAGIKANASGFQVRAATSTRALPGGLVPAHDWPGAEFGARPRRGTYPRRSILGNSHTVTRTLNRQFRPRAQHGRIAFDAASEIGTRLVAVWVTTIVDVTRQAARAEG
jgi:hypothetical protein